MKKISLKQLLGRGGPGDILVLGAGDYFTSEEIARALKKRGYEATESYRHGACVAVLESRRMTPVQERVGEPAYEAGVAHYPIAELERWMSEALVPRQVLMALKLSKEHTRLLRLLRNEYLDDEFFLELLRLYRWESDELMGSDADRAVLIALLERFLDLRVYERDALYSPATLLRLIRSTDKPRVLEALLDLPAFAFRQKGGRRLSVAEAVAEREILLPRTVVRLLHRNESDIDRRLAANPALDAAGRHTLYERGDEETLKSLACHPALEEELFDALLRRPETVRELLRHQPIGTERLERIPAREIAAEILEELGSNERMEAEVYFRLSESGSPGLLSRLAANPAVPPAVLERLAAQRELTPLVAQNPSASEPLLRRLFDGAEPELLPALAQNPSTPAEILEALYARGEFVYHKALAANPSTPLAILHQLKTDHRLWLILQHNTTFVREANKEMGMR